MSIETFGAILKKVGTFFVWYRYGLIWSVVKVSFVTDGHSWEVTNLLFEDVSWLNFPSCILCNGYLQIIPNPYTFTSPDPSES